MKISVILGHPDPKSFNHAIAERAVETLKRSGHEVRYHNLYTEKFDPNIPQEEIAEAAKLPADIEKHCNELAEADGIIVVHPNWWGQPPAIVKGWIDRIFRPGVAYRFLEGDKGEGIPIGLLKAKAALIFNTGNTPMEREMEVFGDPLEGLWKTCLLGFCGIENVFRRYFTVIVTSTEVQRRQWLQEVEEAIGDYFPA